VAGPRRPNRMAERLSRALSVRLGPVQAAAVKLGYFAAAATVVVGAAMTAPATAAPAPSRLGAHLTGRVHLGVTSPRSTYQPGTAVPLRFVVTNMGPMSCVLSVASEGALSVISGTRNGQALTPSYSLSYPIDGAARVVTARLRRVRPGGSVSFVDNVGSGQGLEVFTPLADQLALNATWPTSTAGTYEFHVAYQVPALAGTAGCLGQSNWASVSFRVHARQSSRSIANAEVVVGASLALLLAVSLGVVWQRSRARWRPARSGALVAMLTAGFLSAGAVVATPSGATVSFDFGSSDADTQQFDSCVASINKFDPSMFPTFNGPGRPNVTIEVSSTNNDATPHGRNDVIRWEPFYHGEFADGVIASPCASLYHELVHAKRNAQGITDRGECGSTGIPIDEVAATLAENSYRESNGLPSRVSYASDVLPSSLAACAKPPPPPPPAKPTGVSEGDPHLKTIDGEPYDFQAVGEFVAVASSAGDLTVQVRESPFEQSKSIAVDTAVAMDVSGTRLGFYLVDGVVIVQRDGTPVVLANGRTKLPRGAVLRQSTSSDGGAIYSVTWADGTVASVRPAAFVGLALTFTPAKARAGTLSGLLGNFDGNPYNDVADKGRQPFKPTFARLYPAFANSWRVTPGTSLFDYAKGTSTATFTDRSFPERPRTVVDLTPTARASARAACGGAGVTRPVDVSNCTLDVAVTGSADFAVSSAAIEAVTRPVPRTTSGAAAAGRVVTAVVGAPGSVERPARPHRNPLEHAARRLWRPQIGRPGRERPGSRVYGGGQCHRRLPPACLWRLHRRDRPGRQRCRQGHHAHRHLDGPDPGDVDRRPSGDGEDRRCRCSVPGYLRGLRR
jgi:hypothetical protein